MAFFLAHILCSWTHQYKCDDVLEGFGDGRRSDTGSKTVLGQIFVNINVHSPGFITPQVAGEIITPQVAGKIITPQVAGEIVLNNE